MSKSQMQRAHALFQVVYQAQTNTANQVRLANLRRIEAQLAGLNLRIWLKLGKAS